MLFDFPAGLYSTVFSISSLKKVATADSVNEFIITPGNQQKNAL